MIENEFVFPGFQKVIFPRLSVRFVTLFNFAERRGRNDKLCRAQPWENYWKPGTIRIPQFDESSYKLYVFR